MVVHDIVVPTVFFLKIQANRKEERSTLRYLITFRLFFNYENIFLFFSGVFIDVGQV